MKKLILSLMLITISPYIMGQSGGRQLKQKKINLNSAEANTLEIFILYPQLPLTTRDTVYRSFIHREDDYFEHKLSFGTTNPTEIPPELKENYFKGQREIYNRYQGILHNILGDSIWVDYSRYKGLSKPKKFGRYKNSSQLIVIKSLFPNLLKSDEDQIKGIMGVKRSEHRFINYKLLNKEIDKDEYTAQLLNIKQIYNNELQNILGPTRHHKYLWYKGESIEGDTLQYGTKIDYLLPYEEQNNLEVEAYKKYLEKRVNVKDYFANYNMITIKRVLFDMTRN